MTAPRYRFAVISDVHIDLEDGGKKTYFIYAQENLARALSNIKELGCSFIVSAGDQVTNASGAEAEWRLFRRMIADSGYDRPVFTALGNHETRFSQYGCTLEHSLGEFRRYSGIDSLPVSAPSGKCYYEFIEPVFGDSFIFMALDKGPRTNLIDDFSDGQTDWAEALLKKRTAEGRRIFLVQHAGIYGFGAGDIPESPAYDGAIHLSDDTGRPYKNNRRFFELVRRYKDVIWLYGHSHVDFADGVCYSDGGGEACRMIHIPALAGTTRIAAGKDGKNTLDRTFYPGIAQGYIADVYKDRTVLRGYNFYTGAPYEDVVIKITR